MKDIMLVCEKCYWWVCIETELGECRIRSVSRDVFPRRKNNQWCGEFCHKDPAELDATLGVYKEPK